MNRTRTDYDEYAVILASEDPGGREAGGGNGGQRLLGRDNLMSEKGGLDERVVLHAGMGNGRRTSMGNMDTRLGRTGAWRR